MSSIPPSSALPAGQFHRHFWDPRRATGRLSLSTVLGMVAVSFTPGELEWRVRATAGWCVAAALIVVSDWGIILRADAGETARSAGAEDLPRVLVWLLTFSASVFSLFSACFVLRDAESLPPEFRRTWAGMALAAIVLAWVLTHTAYAMRYAHLYYRRGRRVGLSFPGEDEPRYSDFAYYAFTVGMSFASSDVQPTTSLVRRITLLHALTSFVFNVIVLALAINVTMLFLR